MQNKVRYLHILMSHDSARTTASLNWSAFLKKFPGEHIILTRPELIKGLEGNQNFSELHCLDVGFMQKISFTPLLGDQTAFQFFWKAVRELSQSKWDRIFNLGTDALSTSLATLFVSGPVVGSFKQGAHSFCNNSPLKLNAILARWKMGHPSISQLLSNKAFQQLDLAPWEEQLSRVLELKSQKKVSGIKNTLVGLRLTEANSVEENVLTFLGQVFTLVALDEVTEKILSACHSSHIQLDRTQNEVLFDVVLTDTHRSINLWAPTINLTGLSVDELTEKLSDILPMSFAKWASLSFMFDYLGSSKCSLLAEKILSRNERQALQPFLHHEVMQLRDFAKLMLENFRRPDTEAIRMLELQLAEKGGLLAFVAAIELSLTERLDNLIIEQDLSQLKRRLRSLNEFYERLHRACTLEIPKTDLALTL